MVVIWQEHLSLIGNNSYGLTMFENDDIDLSRRE
jgi:hypothetical protein